MRVCSAPWATHYGNENISLNANQSDGLSNLNDTLTQRIRMTEIKVEEPEEKSAPMVKELQVEEPKTKDVQTEKTQAKKTHVEEPEEIDSKAEELKAKEKTNEEKKQESYDLDDEYFELDGF